MKLKKLTDEEKRVMEGKGTERPFTGEYWNTNTAGVYFCRRCGAALYLSSDKFDSDCGWPSFDDEIKGAVKRSTDADGSRTEITCARCNAHLGHVFFNEFQTRKNIRHCVNSISIKLVPESKLKLPSIVLGGGCFWCIESAFMAVDGVVSTTCGYAGGKTKNPAYEEVCTGKTGHAEVVKVTYDPQATDPQKLLKIFFHIHDPTLKNRQGNDIGTQYRSMLLYTSAQQKKEMAKAISEAQKGLAAPILTEVKKLAVFYKAEEYHQKYFEKNPLDVYCMLNIPKKMATVKKLQGQ